MDYGARAKENFQSGYSCAQAVFLACTEDMGLDTETRARLASSFGGGMGGMRQVCGAVTVAVGCGMICLPLGVIVAGGALIAFSLLSGPGGDEQ